MTLFLEELTCPTSSASLCLREIPLLARQELPLVRFPTPYGSQT